LGILDSCSNFQTVPYDAGISEQLSHFFITIAGHFPGIELVKGSRLHIANANGQTLLPSLQAGAHGYSGVMTNFHPELYVWLCDNWQQDPEKADIVSAYLSTASLAEYLDYPICAKDYQKSIGNFASVAARVREAGNYYSAHFQSNMQQMVQLGEMIKKQLGILR